MLKVGRILDEYSDAGSVNQMLALWGFVDDQGTFLTKAGHVGVAYRLQGIDYEGLTHPERRVVVHRVEAALRLLDEHCRLYQYFIKTNISEISTPRCVQPVADEAIQRRTEYLNGRRHELYEMSLYFVLMYEPAGAPRNSTRVQNLFRSPQSAFRNWLSMTHTLSLVAAEVDRSITALHFKAQAFEVQLAELEPKRLKNADAFAFFRRLVNYDVAAVSSAHHLYDTHLDYFVADSAVECHRDHLVVGRRHVKALSMKEPPNQTFAHVLSDLHAIPGEFVGCLEWQRIANDRMRRDVQARRRHFFNKRVSLVNYLSPETHADEMLVDDSAAATVRQLGDALTEIEVNGHFFGSCSLTLVLHDRDARALERQLAEAMKVVAAHDGSFFEETYNLLNAWLSIVPGNVRHNLRRVALLETNAADLSFVFTIDGGEPHSSHLGREALAIFETPYNTPFAFNLHVEDVGHSLVLGATGSGKSFLINFLVTHAQKYDPMTVVLDLGQSYRKLATLLQGRHLEIGLRNEAVTINPFAFEPTPTHVHFLHSFVRVLLEGGDGYRLNDLEDREVYDAVTNVYALDRSQRRLMTVANLLPRALSGRLQKWVDGGRYAALFDNEQDTLTFERLQVFEFDRMREYPAVLEPLLFYFLHRVTERVQAETQVATFKLCVLDEAWRFIQHPTLRAYVHEGLKTWRKHNAAMMLATQSVEDFASGDLLRTVVESCPTKLFLASPSVDREKYAELFQLNNAELDLLVSLIPRQQILLKRAGLTKVLTLTVDPKSYWIYTNTPVDNERLASVFREHGFEAGLDRLVASA